VTPVILMPDWLQQHEDEHPMVFAPAWSREDMEVDENPLVRDVAFNRHSMNDGHHVSPSDNGMIQVGIDNIRVELIQGIDEHAFKKTLTAATRATIGLDLSQTLPGDWETCDQFELWFESQPDKHNSRTDMFMDGFDEWTKCTHSRHKTNIQSTSARYLGRVPMEDWEEMLKGGLQTALETQTIVFAVSGVSRTCTHQLVRSRRASFHQQSQRAGFMGSAPEVRIPESVFKNDKAREAYYKAVLAAHQAYRVACDEDISYQDARFVLPEGTTNFIMLEYPVREFLNVYAYRACSMFQWEIVAVMRQAREALVKAHPWMEPYVKISCEKTGPVTIPLQVIRAPEGGPNAGAESYGQQTVEHHCTFQGWEDVEGQCDFPWAKHEARTFKPEHHRITREK
jgi:flavin-dependent thymidylate synthase